MRKQIKITVEYVGHFYSATSEDYKITKIVGAPTVEVKHDGKYVVTRVGSIINEAQADELSQRTELTTLPRKG